MHRRAVTRLSRRVELSSTSVTASTPTFSSQRSFQSSAPHRNSESGDNNNDGTPSAPSKPSAFKPKFGAPKPGAAKFGAPKFGSKWGPGTSQPVGLSAAEQALRDAMVAKSKPPPPPPSAPEQERSSPIRNQRWAKRSYTDSPAREENLRGLHHRQRHTEDHQAPSGHRRDWNRERRPREEKQVTRSTTDWDCPSCQKMVFQRHSNCPFCKTPRPDSPSWQARPPRDREQSAKFRSLGRSFLADSAEAEPASKTPKKDTAKAKESTAKVDKKPAVDQWSWDMSSLENLETEEVDEDVPQDMKKSKRRDGGKQRGSESAEFEAENRDRRREARQRKKDKEAKREQARAAPQPLYLPEFISVNNLADVIGVRPAQFIMRMEEMGFEDVEYNHVLDAETAGLVAAEYNYEAIFDTGSDNIEAAPVPEDVSGWPSRPPVVTIMGHVDHGKTTILDWLRNSSVAATEHGGITQHIGAFSVPMPSGKLITFLDTPGHSAFLEMRRRGADVTDIVVLVVAADDSVKPQTIEAIKHATQANVPIIVAMSKIDKEGRNPDRVKQDLSVHGVHVEDYGGDVQAIGVSGKTGEGMLELEEAIGALSEMLDHRAQKTGNVEGWVLEASTKTYGRVASALIRRGTLRPGDIIVAGNTWARVRTLRNEAGLTVSEATPGMPIEIDGWRDQPAAGAEILQASTEQKAKDVVQYRQDRVDTEKLSQDMVAINEARRELSEKRKLEEEAESDDAATPTAAEPSGPKAVNFIIKADVDGSAEAVMNSMAAIGNNEVYANILRSGVGPITEFDVEHAAAAKGRLISFNQPIDPGMMRMAEQDGVKIMDHNIIYKLIDDVKADLSQYLAPTITQRVTGEAEIGQIFDITVKGRDKIAIAGCRVRNGTVNKARKVRVLRRDVTVYDGTMTSLKNVKKDVTEMRKDTECGIGFDGWSEFAVGDHIQCYEEIHEKRFL
ncbi:Translation initiation factor IF-2 [Penicillium verhagenii]|uniref:Translation initiation factor IF-2 n=1 Tax=Penicillium verhagenii TaxID=1562060 RepID=UPI0025458119|nr:Translation initiation factor IF-2 [Penicillium verhagenii]KAJ5947178.1 Translation initiation factor IF-2 [Penicillium verhagenii]